MSRKILLRCLVHRTFMADLRCRDDAWLRHFYTTVEHYRCESTKWDAVLQQLPLIRLADGSTHCCAQKEGVPGEVGSPDTRLVFLPCMELKAWMLTPYLNLVKPSLLLAPESVPSSVPLPRDTTTGGAAAAAPAPAAELFDASGVGRSAAVRLVVSLGVCRPWPQTIILRHIVPYHLRTISMLLRTPD
jgi:hypothetical protein